MSSLIHNTRMIDLFLKMFTSVGFLHAHPSQTPLLLTIFLKFNFIVHDGHLKHTIARASGGQR